MSSLATALKTTASLPLWLTELGAVAKRLLSAGQATEPRLHNRAQEAEELRDYAHNFIQTDPGFAADLFAAADRHEEGRF